MQYGMPILSYGQPCVQICEGTEPFPIDAAWPIIEGLAGIDMIIVEGVLREKTAEEKQAYVDAVAADAVQQEAAWQLAKPPMLKAVENIYVGFLSGMWTDLLRTLGVVPADYTITVDNTDASQNILYLMQVRAVDFDNYSKMAGEFDRLKNTIVAMGGVMSKVKYHTA